MKDVYMLDMLGVEQPVLEAELESRMVSKIKDVMLELGYGFAFIGNQYRIIANDKDYYIDLLFSNRRLNALVAIELKVGRFKPEYAGKMNFYLNLLDDFVFDNCSISLSKSEEQEIDRLIEQLSKTKSTRDKILKLVRGIEHNTIDKIMAMDEIELVEAVLSGKIKPPR